MRPTTLSFILAELLDLATTIMGLRMGAMELNPIAWDWLMPLKVLAVIIVAFALENKRPLKIDWIIVAVAFLPVIWNVINICLMV